MPIDIEALLASMNPKEPTSREKIQNSIGDILTSIGAGLANRGRGGSSSGAGAALMAGTQRRDNRAAQGEQARQQALQNALQVAGLQQQGQKATLDQETLQRNVALERGANLPSAASIMGSSPSPDITVGGGNRAGFGNPNFVPGMADPPPSGGRPPEVSAGPLFSPEVRSRLGISPGGTLQAPPVPSVLDPGFPSQGIPPADVPGQFNPPPAVAAEIDLQRDIRKRVETTRADETTKYQVAQKFGVGEFAPTSDPNTGDTVLVDDKRMLWNPSSQTYDIELGRGTATPNGTYYAVVKNGEIAFVNPTTKDVMETGIRAESASDVSDAMRRNAGYLLQAAASNVTARIMEEKVLDGTISGIETAMLGMEFQVINAERTPEGQQLAQAMREFTEARLRPASGAAVPESEITRDRETYFPRYGDTEVVIRQKQAARARVLASLRIVSGAAADTNAIMTPDVIAAYGVLAKGDEEEALRFMELDGWVK